MFNPRRLGMKRSPHDLDDESGVVLGFRFLLLLLQRDNFTGVRNGDGELNTVFFGIASAETDLFMVQYASMCKSKENESINRAGSCVKQDTVPLVQYRTRVLSK